MDEPRPARVQSFSGGVQPMRLSEDDVCRMLGQRDIALYLAERQLLVLRAELEARQMADKKNESAA